MERNEFSMSKMAALPPSKGFSGGFPIMFDEGETRSLKNTSNRKMEEHRNECVCAHTCLILIWMTDNRPFTFR